MSTILFGGTISLADAATPSQGNFLVAYDSDGIIKQKDSDGLVKPFYDFSGAGGGGEVGSLVEVLGVGNMSGTYSIIMGNDSSIENFSRTNKITLENSSNGILTIESSDDGIKISSSNSEDDFILKSYNLEAATSDSIKNPAIISSQNSTLGTGSYNSLILGGSGILGTESNTVYIGGTLNIKNEYSFPTVDGSENQVLITDGQGNLSWASQSGGTSVGGGGDLYTGTAAITVGGIESGTYFDNNTMQEMWDALLNPELFPSLSNPSMTFTKDVSTLQIIGLDINVNLSSTFNQGSISPVYMGGPSKRSGLPSAYSYTTPSGAPSITNITTTALNYNVPQFTYTVQEGTKTWSNTINYSAGLTPLSSLGNDYGTALPAGSLNKSVSITGVYPVFATTSLINTLSQQTLSTMTSDIIVDLVAEPFGTGEKQTIMIPDAWSNITGVMQLNEFSGEYEYLGDGNAASSLTVFTITPTTFEYSTGLSTNYNEWVYNISAEIGARRLKFTT